MNTKTARKDTEESKDQALISCIVDGMQEKKATDITIINFSKIGNSVADYFIICSGSSDRQVEAIADSVEEFASKKLKEEPWKKEGKTNREWIIIDYVNVIVHVFQTKARARYSIEDLWGDADIKNIDE